MLGTVGDRFFEEGVRRVVVLNGLIAAAFAAYCAVDVGVISQTVQCSTASMG